MKLLLHFFLLLLLLVGCNGSREARERAYIDSISRDLDRKLAALDSLVRADTLTQHKAVKELTSDSPKYLHHTGKSKYANDGHPGTKPDDNMYGFDPWDDEDDAYNVERNQQDPYPDEW